MKKLIKYVGLIILHLFLICLAVSLFKTRFIIIILLFISLFTSPLLLYYFMWYSRKFSEELKKNIQPKVFQLIGNIQACHNEKLELEKDIINTGLFPRSSQYMYDDKFKGVYKGVNYEVLEIISPKKQIIMSFDLNKNSNNRTIVVPKNSLFQKNSDMLLFWIPIILFVVVMYFSVNQYSLLKILEYLLFTGLFVTFFVSLYFIRNQAFNPEALNKITLEDIELNKRYNVYSSDEVEARYLVTPSFIEEVLELQTAFRGKDIKCSFYNQKLILLVDTKKDVFEFGNLFQSLLKFKIVDDFYSEINSIFSIIDHFKLNKHTGL